MTRALVLRTAGTNCDRETKAALELVGAAVELAHVNRLVAEPARLDDVALVVIPGGFSYGDDVAAGRLFGLDLRQHLAAHLERFVARGGFLLGVCNGFQVLVDTGLLEPGRARSERQVALTGNAPGRYQCRWVLLEAEESACGWLAPGWRLPCRSRTPRAAWSCASRPRSSSSLCSARSCCATSIRAAGRRPTRRTPTAPSPTSPGSAIRRAACSA